MKGKAFENPLLSHARMRGLYRGLVEVRGLKLVPRQVEACYVAPCIGLAEDDFIFSPGSALAADYIRLLGSRAGSGAPTLAGVRRAKAGAQKPFAGTSGEGLLCAAGAARAFKTGAGDRLAVALLEGRGGSQAAWARLLEVAEAGEIPLLVVALPGSGGPDWTAAGRKAGIPVIPVDAADAVGLYRVAQEAIVRARADRRGAVIECVQSGADPVKLMAAQLLAKRIATEAWVGAVEPAFKKLLAERGMGAR